MYKEYYLAEFHVHENDIIINLSNEIEVSQHIKDRISIDRIISLGNGHCKKCLQNKIWSFKEILNAHVILNMAKTPFLFLDCEICTKKNLSYISRPIHKLNIYATPFSTETIDLSDVVKQSAMHRFLTAWHYTTSDEQDFLEDSKLNLLSKDR